MAVRTSRHSSPSTRPRSARLLRPAARRWSGRGQHGGLNERSEVPDVLRCRAVIRAAAFAERVGDGPELDGQRPTRCSTVQPRPRQVGAGGEERAGRLPCAGADRGPNAAADREERGELLCIRPQRGHPSVRTSKEKLTPPRSLLPKKCASRRIPAGGVVIAPAPRGSASNAVTQKESVGATHAGSA